MKNNMLRKAAAICMGLVICAGTLAGCQKAQGPDGSTTTGTAAVSTQSEQTSAKAEITGKIKYNFWGNADQLEAINKQLDVFRGENKGIEVEANVADWGTYWDKLKTESAGGEAPDVFAMSSTAWLPYFAINGFVADLGEYAKKDGFDLGIYNKAALELNSYDSKQYSLPQDMNVIVLAYNADIFAKAGIQPPDGNWTWDDLLKAAQLTTLDSSGKNAADPAFDKKNIVQWGITNLANQTDAFVDPLCFSLGGSLFTLDGKSNLLNEKTQKGIRFLHDLVYKYNVAPDFDTLGGNWNENDLFAQGKCAMSELPSYWLFTYANKEDGIKVNFEAFQLPKGDSGKRYNAVQSKGISIFAGTKNPDAAWELIKFITGKETATSVAASGMGLAAIDEVNKDVFMKDAPGTAATKQVLLDAFENPCPVPKDPGYGTANWMVGNDYLYMSVFRNSAYNAEIFKKADAEVNKVFEEN